MVKISGEAHFTDDLVPVVLVVLAGCAVQRSSYRDRDRFIQISVGDLNLK